MPEERHKIALKVFAVVAPLVAICAIVADAMVDKAFAAATPTYVTARPVPTLAGEPGANAIVIAAGADGVFLGMIQDPLRDSTRAIVTRLGSAHRATVVERRRHLAVAVTIFYDSIPNP